jgi:hypothetical protein
MAIEDGIFRAAMEVGLKCKPVVTCGNGLGGEVQGGGVYGGRQCRRLYNVVSGLLGVGIQINTCSWRNYK